MKNKLSYLELILLAAPFPVLALCWKQLPARVPMHWNLTGEIDGWASKPSLLLMPLIGISAVALMSFLPRFDPKLRQNLGDHGRMPAILPILRLTLLLLLDVIFAVQIAVSLGARVDSGRLLLVATLIFLTVIGNFSTNLRPNYFVGIRTPWTLQNGETWRATHRLGGRLLFFGSVLLLLLQFFVSTRVFGWITCVSLLLLVIWAMIYSWHHCQNHAAFTP